MELHAMLPSCVAQTSFSLQHQQPSASLRTQAQRWTKAVSHPYSLSALSQLPQSPTTPDL